jgi:hypothetical protein
MAADAMTSAQPETPAATGLPRRLYRVLLDVSFQFFSVLRVLSYLPMLWAIHASGDSSQHSLWTWGIWLMSHLTMAGWLFERNAGRLDRAIGVTLANASMCAASLMLIASYR